MLSQFKTYSQSKKNPVLSQRLNVFCSPNDDDENEEADYSKFLDMKGNWRPVLFSVSLDNSKSDNSVHHLPAPVAQLPGHWHFVVGACRVNVLIACLKSLPQRIQTPDSLLTRWPPSWRREDPSWKPGPRKTTKTILFSRKFLPVKPHCSQSVYTWI